MLFDGLYVDRRETLSQTGAYTLTVRGPDATATGVYSFALLLAPEPQAFAIDFGDTVSHGVPAAGAGNLEGPGSVDTYTFDAVGAIPTGATTATLTARLHDGTAITGNDSICLVP